MNGTLLDHLAPRPIGRGPSGMMSLGVTRFAGKGSAARYGVETVWNHPFTEYQISTAPPSLQVILRSDSTWLVPGSSEGLDKLLRSRGFAAATYTLDADEKAWIVGMLPPDKARAWRDNPSSTATLVVCAGQIKESTGLVAWWQGDTVGTCALGEGLKVEEVAPVQGGGLVSNLSAAVGNALSSVYEWVAPSALKNAVIVSATAEPTPTQRENAAAFLRSYDTMAASVRDVEGLVAKGAVLSRAQGVQLRISKIHLAQNAQVAEQVRKGLGLPPGSPNRAKLRARVKMDRRDDAFGGAFLVPVVYAIVALSFAAAVWAASDAYVRGEEQKTKQTEMAVKLRQDLLARCSDPTLPAALRRDVCGALKQESSAPLPGSKEGPDFGKLAMWVGIGAVSVAGAVVVTKGLATARPAIQLATQRARRRDAMRPPLLQGR